MDGVWAKLAPGMLVVFGTEDAESTDEEVERTGAAVCVLELAGRGLVD